MNRLYRSLAVAVILLSASLPVQCQYYPNERTMNVDTFCDVKVWPDIARLQYRIQKENMLASRALEDCKLESNRFLETLKKTELDKAAAVEETGIVISSQNTPYRQPQSTLPGGFTAAKDFTLSFPIKEKGNVDAVLQQIAKVLDTLSPEGFSAQSSPNRGSYEIGQSVVQFVVTHTDQYEEQGLQEAIQKNRPEAERKAKWMGVKIVKIRNSNFTNSGYYLRGGYPSEQKVNEINGTFYQEYPIRISYSVNYVVEEIQ